MTSRDDDPASTSARTEIWDQRTRVEDVERFVSDDVKRALAAHGIERLTGMQEECLAAARGRGTDVVCRAPTGSGKTLAYVLPIAHALESRSGVGVRAMVVAPTRELANQVKTHVERYCGERDACALCVGGAAAKPQEDAIRVHGATIVVGTPGRIKEFIERGVIEMKTVEIQVLDEIDRLLDGGFEGEIEAVMKPPGTCQTLCFSATISPALSRFLDRKLVPGYAEVLATGRGGSNVGGRVEHLSYTTKAGDDATGIAVVDALEHYASKRVDGRVGGQAIVFTETKSTAERLRATLTNLLTTVRKILLFFFFDTLHESIGHSSMTNKTLRDLRDWNPFHVRIYRLQFSETKPTIFLFLRARRRRFQRIATYSYLHSLRNQQ